MSPTAFSPANCDEWEFLLWLESASVEDLERFGRDSRAEFLLFRTEGNKCSQQSGTVEIDGVLYEYAWPGRNLPSEGGPKSGSYATAFSYGIYFSGSQKP
jgi:hypothetical protein